MNFSLNNDQIMLRDSAEKFVRNNYDFDKRKSIIKDENSFSSSNWSMFSELGWLMLPFSEDDGGLGCSLVETMILLEEFGKGLVVEPYIPSIVLGGGFLRRATISQKEKFLPNLLSGKCQMAFAVQEYEKTFNINETSLRAKQCNDHFILEGVKSVVQNGDRADLLVVLARSSGQPGDSYGLSLFFVDTKSHGIHKKTHRMVDGTRAAEINFDKVLVPANHIIGELDNAADLTNTVINEAILALGAEATGILSELLYRTVEYTKTRKQFGVPIGSFQALQHRMTNMFIAYEQTKSLLLCATLKALENHDDANKAVHALKVQIGKAGRLIAQEAIQMHGGMGMTDELPIGHYFKRITAIDALFGNADQHIRAFAGNQ